MPRPIVAVTVGAAACLCTFTLAHSPSAEGSVEPDVVVSASDGGSTGETPPDDGVGDPDDDGSGDGCTWSLQVAGATAETTGQWDRWEGAFQAALAASPIDPPSASMYQKRCPDGTWELVWRPDGAAPALTVDDLVPGAYDEARRRVPTPVLEVAPPVIQGSLVNAPLWLAVTAPAPVTARAEAGEVWAQVDATFMGLKWDMGNGDIVECEGPGEPWSHPDPAVEWPTPECGYNYEFPSTPEFTGTDNSWYHITLTAHWDVRVTGSDGRNVALDQINRTLEFDYVIWELQTVGHP